MATLDLEAQYNNRMRVPEHAQIGERWAKMSSAYRGGVQSGDLDRTYGPKPRQRYDLYRPKGAPSSSPLVVYIHGGYWQRGERQANAFVARELNALGITVAVPSYTLCPDVSVMEIVEELRQALKSIHEATRQRPVVVGHSAGGHLTAAMVATDWSKVGGVPADLVRSGYAISGVFDLPPLVPTSLNAALRLDDSKARAASPLFWPAPSKDRTIVAAVGGDESEEFIRQSLDLAGTWSKAGVKAECVVVPSTNHFTIVDEMVRPESAMLARIAAMAKG